MDYIRSRVNILSSKAAFISALQQKAQYDRYKQLFVEYGFRSIEYYQIGGQDQAGLKEALDNFDILYFHGGDPYKILKRLNSAGFADYLLDSWSSEKLIVSTSGSSIAFSEDIALLYSLYPKAKQKISIELERGMKGLELFPFMTLPHYTRYDKKRTIELIKEYSKKKGYDNICYL